MIAPRAWPVRARIQDAGVVPLAALGLAIAYAVALLVRGDNIVLLAPLLAALVAVIVFVRPVAGVYLIFGTAILLEQFVILGLNPITVGTHFYQNLSAYTEIPLRLSVADLLLLLTLAAWCAQVMRGKAHVTMGRFGWALAGYGGVFLLGVVIGVARGGFDADAALAELRGPVLLCLVYLLSANCLRGRAAAQIVAWELVVLVGIKALQGIQNFIDGLSVPYDLEAVTGHEDVIFFDLIFALALAAFVLRLRTRLAIALYAVTPLILTTLVLTERRVGFIALGVSCIVVLLVTARLEPRRALTLGAIGLAAAVIYGVTFWDADGAIAQPIRAIRAIAEPSYVSVRDQMSDNWRVKEDLNIANTIRQLPLTGVGVGQEYLVYTDPPPLPPAFTFWRFITHNALLWLWLKAGVFGAFALWFLVARVVTFGASTAARLRDVDLRWFALMPVCLVVAQIVFSAVELGLSYSRTMIVLGTVLGLASSLFPREPEAPSR